MTQYLVTDTEGSGLFIYKNPDGSAKPSTDPDQPRVASICMLAVDSDLNVTEEYFQFVRPDGWKMDPGATAVNGLTDEFLAANGKPILPALEWYTARIKEGRTFVAHHAQHDGRHLRAELRHAGMPDLFEETPQICTMRSLMGIVKKPGGRGGWPKLTECISHFGLQLQGDHTAQKDAHACLGLLRHMKTLGLLRDGKINYAKRGYMKKVGNLQKDLEDSAALASGKQLSDGDEF